MTPEEAKEYFPTKVTSSIPLPIKLKYLVMAPAKWGKTTFFSDVPNGLLLGFEEGYGFVSTNVICITGWDKKVKDRGSWEDDETGVKYATAMEVVDALEAYNPYDFITIDTGDQAVKMAAEWECKKAGIAHPSEGGDYGKGWDLYQTTPFRLFYNRLIKLGVGVAVTTHVKEDWKKDKYQQEHFVRETSLPGGVQRFCHNQADVIINGSFGKRRKGFQDRDRLISFDATNEILAGTRVRGVHIPNKYIVTPPQFDTLSNPWKQWCSFFNDSPNAGKLAEDYYLANFRVVKSGEDENEEEDLTIDKPDKPDKPKTITSEITKPKTHSNLRPRQTTLTTLTK